MIEQILPDCTASAEAFEDPVAVDLFPEERAIIANAVARRQREFATARMCAREALAKLGEPPVPILRGERNAPVWPVGVVGSITHCTGYRGAVVAHRRDIASIGIDAERNQPLPDGILDAIALPAELPQLRILGNHVCWDRVLFCAKEAIFKVWYPLTALNLGFDEAEVTIDPPDTFIATLLTPHPDLPPILHGRYLHTPTHVATAIALPAP